ncbi:putative mfs-multidrug-resistance transporter [Cystobasidium minutum MCA 4210]|uniref:putative mfs-multidrug-resistance transporter n=1 Tax=Cystobasidium minutum MCA 4210 TaxID=1397322 RepID=UPI0034CF1D57|eukprot:jgi/Rhomi1/184074/fgenesh1_pm.5_\
MQVADGIQDPEQYTLRKRPWRPRVTPFPHILRQEYRGDGSKEKPFIITWLPEDPENPQTYSNPYKWTVTMISAIVTLAVALASSAYSGAVTSIRQDFNVRSEEVIILGVSLFVLGFALGPLIWAPLSEVFGRRPVLVFSYVMFTLWNGVAAASPNMGALIVFRFLAGAFGSSPLANSGGTISDMFSANMRGLATALFAAAPFLGPALGPIIGGFLGETEGWRWVQLFLCIFTGVLTVIAFFFVPETYAPALLRKRAAHLSKVTGKYYRAPMDAEKELDIRRVFLTQLSMPWVLLFQEPIVMVISIYMAIVYGTLYMLFAAYPIVFQQTRGWSPGIGGLAFLGLLVGMMIGVTWTIFITNPRYIKTAKANGGRAPPETRLQPSLLGAPLLIIGLAWFAATCGPEVHWIVPILSGVPFGLAMLLLFLSLMNYLVDVYTIFAASVLAGNSVLRSLFGAAFPLFTTPMYRNLGIHWASAVPGFLALACLPFPYLFYKYGASVRAKCKWTVKAETLLAAMMAGGQAAQKKEAPSAEENNEDVEAAMDAPVEEDSVLEVREREQDEPRPR